jgi:hypothetical protein
MGSNKIYISAIDRSLKNFISVTSHGKKGILWMATRRKQWLNTVISSFIVTFSMN